MSQTPKQVCLKTGAEYMLIVRKSASGREVSRSGWSSNLVTQNGIDLCLGNTGSPQFNVEVGAGNAPPQLSDTNLQSYLARTTNFLGGGDTVYQTLSEPFWARQEWTARFASGTFDNANISEVGMTQNITNTLYSRALVVDANGNPASVTVQSDEFLDVLVRHTLVMGTSTGTFNQLILGESEPFEYAIRPISMSGAGNWGGNSGNVGRRLPLVQFNTNASYTYANASLAGANANDMIGTRINLANNGGLREPYVAGDNVAKLRINYDLDRGNHANGLSGIKLNFSTFVVQILLTPAVPKINTQTYYIDLDVSMSNIAVPE